MPWFVKKAKRFQAEQWFPDRDTAGVCTCASDECGRAPHVHTTHQGQAVRLEPGDWVIPEPNGDGHYPCKPDIFAAGNDPADPPPTAAAVADQLAGDPAFAGSLVASLTEPPAEKW